MRWLRELFKPALKCMRLGHNIREETRYGYTPSPQQRWGYVAARVTQHRDACTRCDHGEEWSTRDYKNLDGLTMSNEAWDEMRKTGFTRG